jgi:dTDP-4-dehydrorhamnose reductase
MGVYDSIVITGGKGMLAHDLLDALRRRGQSPIAVPRSECDITQPDEVAALFKAYRPTLLLNCAAHTGVDLAEDEPDRANAINGAALIAISRNCAELGTKLVHYSTDFVFDGQSDRPYRPDDLTNPLSAYGKSKLLGEANVKQIAPPAWLIIRTAWLFGRHGNCFPETIVKLGQAGRPLRVVQDQQGCPTFTRDLAEATLNLVDANASGVVHVTNDEVTTWYDFAKASLQQFGLENDVLPLTTAQWLEIRPKQARRPAYSVLDGTAYTDWTGARLRGWPDALRDYRELCKSD